MAVKHPVIRYFSESSYAMLQSTRARQDYEDAEMEISSLRATIEQEQQLSQDAKANSRDQTLRADRLHRDLDHTSEQLQHTWTRPPSFSRYLLNTPFVCVLGWGGGGGAQFSASFCTSADFHLPCTVDTCSLTR